MAELQSHRVEYTHESGNVELPANKERGRRYSLNVHGNMQLQVMLRDRVTSPTGVTLLNILGDLFPFRTLTPSLVLAISSLVSVLATSTSWLSA